MAEGLNSVTLMGNLGADPELRYTGSGEPVLNLRLATTEKWGPEENQQRTDWHNVVVWGPRAEALGKLLAKGETVLVQGSIHNKEYEDREGVKHRGYEIRAHKVVLTGRGKANPDDDGRPPQRGGRR